MTQGFVYFCGYDDVVKIGQSIDPEDRIQGHNTSNHKTIEMYATVKTEDMNALESRLHNYFKDDRFPGKREWFHKTDKMQFLINFLQRSKKASDFDVGCLLGMLTANEPTAMYDAAVMEIKKLQRHITMIESQRRELWAMESVIRSFGIHNYAVFKERLENARTQLKGIDEDDAPMFIWKSDGSLEIVGIDDYRIIFPRQIRMEESA